MQRRGVLLRLCIIKSPFYKGRFRGILQRELSILSFLRKQESSIFHGSPLLRGQRLDSGSSPE